MATRRLTRHEKQQQTRSAILRSAEVLFAKQGVAATSLEAIARHAGLTQGAIYSNFESKADLWWALVADRSQTVDPLDYFRGGRPFAEEVRDFGVALARVVRRIARSDFLLDQEFYLFAQRNARVRARVGREIAANARELGEVLERNADARGECLPLSGTQMALVLLALGRGLMFEAVFNPHDATEELFADAFALLGADS